MAVLKILAVKVDHLIDLVLDLLREGGGGGVVGVLVYDEASMTSQHRL